MDESEPVDLSGLSVMLAMPAYRETLPVTTVRCLMATQTATRDHGISCGVLFPMMAGIEMARSACVHRFLKSDANKLFFIDSDMRWKADDFMRMLALSTKVDAVLGSYCGRYEPLEFMVDAQKPIKMNEYGCISVNSGPIGFSVIDRKAVEALADRAPTVTVGRGDLKGEKIRYLFRSGMREDGELVGEDTAFFDDLRELGFKIWCDPTVWLGHVGTKVYEGCLYDQMAQKVAAE